MAAASIMSSVRNRPRLGEIGSWAESRRDTLPNHNIFHYNTQQGKIGLAVYLEQSFTGTGFIISGNDCRVVPQEEMETIKALSNP